MNSMSKQQQGQQKFDEFLDSLSQTSTINPIVGGIGMGKTALLFYLAEKLHKKDPSRPVVVLGGSKRILNFLPKWFGRIENLKEVTPGMHILVDESTQHLNARNSKDTENIEFSKNLAIIRHNDCSAYISTQLLSLLDINALRLGALNFWVKKVSSFSLSFERPELAGKLTACSTMLSRVAMLKHIEPKQIGCVFNDDYLSFFQNKLPSFWSSQLSKSWGIACQ